MHTAPKTRQVSGQARAQAMAVVEEGVHEVKRAKARVQIVAPALTSQPLRNPTVLLVGTALAGVMRCSSAQNPNGNRRWTQSLAG